MAQNILVKPYLQNVSEHQMFMMWETDDSGVGTVEWGSSPFSLTNTVNSSTQSGSGDSRIHTAKINNLLADTKYYYRVTTASGVSSYVYHFKTLANQTAEASLRLIAMSDMQKDGSNPNIFNDLIEDGVIALIQNQYSDDLSEHIDGILIPGDLVGTGGTYSQWQNDFFNPSDSLTPYVPLYPVPGNHEYYGNGLSNFLKYFHLPENGTTANLEEWWYKDMSNVRVIGLNSNSGAADQDVQLDWLQATLDNACNDVDIDFIFAELHHPFKSELWTPGENDFTGEVIAKLESFSTLCGKPSIHFFGHTHAYSRGQSRDHQHLWVNVATAGGAIDNWGEFPNADYDEFVKSQDEYGFVVLDVLAGNAPEFSLKRYSRGDQNASLNNVLRDEISIRRYEQQPNRPLALFPFNDTISPSCFDLKANPFTDAGDTHQATHWQIADDMNDFENTLVYESWKQDENWYNEINTQANDNLTDETPNITLASEQDYFWRVRYRDNHLTWSDWSYAVPFSTFKEDIALTGNLILNPGAESGISNWTGQIEALAANECGSVPTHTGTYLFAVGGVCTNESAYGTASQVIDVSIYNSLIDQGDIQANFSAFMRSYSGTDVPAMKIECRDAANNVLVTSNTISSNTTTWTSVTGIQNIPAGTRNIQVILEGTRNGGTDNDSYLDDLSLILQENFLCSNYVPCPISKTLNNSLNNNAQLVQTAQSIFSTAQLQSNSSVEYKAGNIICLDKGFYTDSSSDFKAIIEACVD